MNHPSVYDARAELRQQIELWKSKRLGGDQPDSRREWVIACFEMALTALSEPVAP